jgi:hypothetical protein
LLWCPEGMKKWGVAVRLPGFSTLFILTIDDRLD